MAQSDTAARLGVYAQRLVENEYVQENLAQAAQSLRAAASRASKRRVEPATDEKLRRQVRDAVQSMTEAANALKTGRKKPKRRGRRVLIVVGVAAGGAAVALAASDELREKLLGASDSPEGDAA
jgi:predicted phosphoribosyltransferase